MQHRIKKQPPRLNLVPLIDVVFILLIFFSVSFKTESGIALILPQSNSSETNRSQITVSIGPDDTLYLNKQVMSTAAQFQQALASALATTPEIILRAHHTIAYQRVIDVMSLIQDSGGQHIVLATQQ